MSEIYKVLRVNVFYLIILLFSSLTKASDEKFIIKNSNRDGVLKTCALKTQNLNIPLSFIAIKSTMERYTKIPNAYDIVVILENGKFNTTRSDDFSNVQDVYVHGTKTKTSFKTGLAVDRIPDGSCIRVIVPDNPKLTKDAPYLSNDSSLQVNFQVSHDVDEKFKKLHFESCKKKYCVNEHFGDECDYECVKPNKLFATSDLDKNNITEYWYETLTSIGKVIFVVEPEKQGSALIIHTRKTQPAD